MSEVNNISPKFFNKINKIILKYKYFLTISISGFLVCFLIFIIFFLLNHNSNEKIKSNSNTNQINEVPISLGITDKPKSLEETNYTGIESDVLTNQTFDCTPRSDHEWYRVDNTLVVDYTNPDIMYINVEYKGIYKTIDAGKTWIKKTSGIKVYARSDDKTKGCYSEYPVIRMDPFDHNHLVIGLSGGGGGFLDPTTPNSQTGGVYQSFDGGENWHLMINNKMNIYVTDVVFDPVTPQTVYYGTASNPASWQGADQNKIYVTNGLIYKTTDNGKTWNELNTGIGNHSSVSAILINPKNTNEIVAPTFSANRQSIDGSGTGLSSGKDTKVDQMGIIKTIDGGKTWTKLNFPVNAPFSTGYSSQTNFNHMYFSPQTSSGSPFGYFTLDGGKTFFKSYYMNIISYDPFDLTGNHLMGYSSVLGTPTNPNLNLFESKDGGKSWNSHGTLPIEIKDLNDAKTIPSSIIWHPIDKNTLYIGGAGGHIWKSTNLGQNWIKLLDYTMLND